MVTNEVRTALAGSLSEGQLQKLVIDRARELGWLVHHCRPAMNKKGEWRTHIQGDKGFFDLVLARGGEVWFVELKTEKGMPTREQFAWIHGCVVQATSKDQLVQLSTHHVALWRPFDWYNGTIERVLS